MHHKDKHTQFSENVIFLIWSLNLKTYQHKIDLSQHIQFKDLNLYDAFRLR